MVNIFQTEQTNILNLLETLVNIDSGSFHKKGVDTVGSILKEEYEKLGFRVMTISEENNGDQLYIQHMEAKDPEILIIAHMDTVFPVGTTKLRPFSVVGDIAKGPGVFDMKGSQVMTLYALKSLIVENHEAYKNVAIILNSDEEIGSVASRSHIELFAERVKNVLIVEPSKGPTIVNSRKGGGKFYLTITGRSAHAGAEPEAGISAIEELAKKIVKLHDLTKKEGINVNVGVVKGGTSPNTIAPSAEAAIDVRFETEQQGYEVDRAIREICSYSEVPGTVLELAGKITRPAWSINLSSQPLTDLIIEEGEKLGINLVTQYSGGGSDGNFTGSLGIPTIDGLGPYGGDAHRESEFLVIPSIELKGTLMVNILKRLSEESPAAVEITKQSEEESIRKKD